MAVDTILETRRLLLRQHRPTDKEAYCVMEMDPEVRRFAGGKPRTRESAEQRFRQNLKTQNEPLGVWATVLKETGAYVGRCGIYSHFDRSGQVIAGEAALSLYIAHAFWRNGYATEAATGLLFYGFKQLKLIRIVANIQEENAASIHIMHKLGFRLISKEEANKVFLHYATTADEYELINDPRI